MRPTAKVAIALLIVAVAGVVAYRVWAKIQEQNEANAPKQAQTQVLTVAVQPVEVGTLTDAVSVTGEIEAEASVDLLPKVSGRLETLRSPEASLFDEGMTVTKGQVLAVIDHDALEAAVQSARATLLRAKVQAKPEVVAATVQGAKAAEAGVNAQLAELAANFRNLEREKDRMIRLCEQGSCTEQMRDKAITAYEAAVETKKSLEAQLAGAQASVALAEAQTKDLADAGVAQADAALKQAQAALSEATVLSPMDGVIGKRFVEEGDMVGPGKPLVRLVQIDRVKAVGNIGERYLGTMGSDNAPVSVQVEVDAYPGQKFDGVVCFVGVEVDRATRTVKLKVCITNSEHRLRPGMFARMKVIVGTRPNATIVPDSALVRLGNETFVFVYNGGRAHRRAVKLGLAEEAMNEVVDGLKPGETIIVRGQRLIQDGAEVVAEAAGKGESRP